MYEFEPDHRSDVCDHSVIISVCDELLIIKQGIINCRNKVICSTLYFIPLSL